MRNAGIDKSQAGIKISGRNITNLRYVDGTNEIIYRAMLGWKKHKLELRFLGEISIT